MQFNSLSQMGPPGPQANSLHFDESFLSEIKPKDSKDGTEMSILKEMNMD